MSCQTCRVDILDGTQSWGFHRPDYYYSSLPGEDKDDDSGFENCMFCSQLRQDVQRAAQSLNQEEDRDQAEKKEYYPLYRWSVRSSPVIRETRSTHHQYTTITFRPVHGETTDTVSPTTNHSGAFWRSLPTRTFYIFDPSNLSIAKRLPGSTNVSSADGAGSQIQKWISTCLTTHERCSGGSTPTSSAPFHTNHASPTEPPARGSPFVPTRLIDVSQEPVYVLHTPSHPDLFPPGTNSPNLNLPPYVTLSHCWGSHPMLMLTSSTASKFTDPSVGIPRGELPKTFRQAIQVARETLGVRYIWIDSLCIMQKDHLTGDAGDFQTEGQLMHKVYRHSFCNIAAVDSVDSTGGLFRGWGCGEEKEEGQKNLNDGGQVGEKQNNKDKKGRGRGEILPLLVTVKGIARPGGSSRILSITNNASTRGDEVERKYVILSDVWQSELLNGLLYTRGWVFQERMLAPRILHFSSTQVFFDCATTSACEILPDGLPAPLDGVASTERNWREMLLAITTTTTTTTTKTPQEPKQSFSLATPTTNTPTPERQKHLTGTADLSLETLWREAVRQYTTCNLTNYGSDRLAAIWGVAKIVRDRLRVDCPWEEYAAGLWRRGLDRQLAWRVADPTRAQRLPELAARHPSWSWASLRGEILVAPRFVVGATTGTSPSGEAYRVSGWGTGRAEEVDYQVESTTTPTTPYKNGNTTRDHGHDGGGDLEPVLASKKLAVMGVLFPARWRRESVGGRSRGFRGWQQWTVEVDGGPLHAGSGTGPRLDVYPDVYPAGEGHMCFLLILGLARSLSGRRAAAYVDDMEDGTGLILALPESEGAIDKTRTGGTRPGLPSGHRYKEYRRLGTFRAWGVKRGEFDKALGEGMERFYLV